MLTVPEVALGNKGGYEELTEPLNVRLTKETIICSRCVPNAVWLICCCSVQWCNVVCWKEYFAVFENFYGILFMLIEDETSADAGSIYRLCL